MVQPQLVLFFLGLLVLWRRLNRRTSTLYNLPGPQSTSYFLGFLPRLFAPEALDAHEELVTRYGRVSSIPGMFGDRRLYIFDPLALYHIFVKDQAFYPPVKAFVDVNNLILGPGLLSTLGEQHRKQRKMLNPAFSVAHMRDLAPDVYNTACRVRDSLMKLTENKGKEVDMMSWLTRAASELIGSCAFGSSFDSLDVHEHQHPYITAIKSLSPTLFKLVIPRMYLSSLCSIGSARLRRFVLDLVPWKAGREIRDISDAMHKTSIELVENAKAAVTTETSAKRKDVMSILVRANMSEGNTSNRLSTEEVIGQVSSFTLAGIDTTSNALARLLWILSRNPDAQARLRQEIRNAKGKDDALSYDALMQLPYLDAVCRETLRLYTPTTIIQRAASKDMVLPLSKPFTCLDGTDAKELFLPEGTIIFASILGSNRNPELWGSDSHEWKPERWLSPLPAELTNAGIPGVYSHLMTFIGGSRSCIGFKFAELEMKTMISVLISDFEFAPTTDIRWQISGLVSPTIEGAHGKQMLPLLVSRAAL